MEFLEQQTKGFFSFWKWEIGGVLLLGFVVVMNLFPNGYVIMGGDVMQNIHLNENYSNLFYEWFGRVSFFYLPFYLLDVMGVSATAQLSWYLGIFLVSAYVSFFVFGRLLFSYVRGALLAFGSLFYATNIYTLYIFTSTWGFTYYQILYVFIPVLTGLYIRSLQSRSRIFSLAFLLVVFFASMSFSNPAFAVSLGMYFILLTAFLFIFRFVVWDKRVLGKIALLGTLSIALNAYWMLPVLPQMRAGIEGVGSSTDINLPESLRKTSNAIFDTLRLVSTYEHDMFYPYNFPYPQIEWLQNPILALTFAPFFLILIGFMFIKKNENVLRSWYLVFFALLAVFTALVAHVRYPFDVFNNFFFQLPGFNVLRGWDKMAIFTPFLIVTLFFIMLVSQQGKKYYRYLLGSSFVLVVLLALPFYFGGIQTKMSYILQGNDEKDYRESRYSALVKIPEPYYDIQEILKKDTADNKISTLPFSPGSSVGRVDLPKWKVNAPHVIPFLYQKSYVEPNQPYIGDLRFAKEYSDIHLNPETIIDVYGLLGVKYIVYQKDADSERVQKFGRARAFLEEKSAIQMIADSEWISLYTVDDSRVFPYMYVSDEAFSFDSDQENMSSGIRAFQETVSPVSYERKNPKEIVIQVTTDISRNSLVYLNEKYDTLWQAVYVSKDGKRVSLAREDTVNFANAWKTDYVAAGGKIEISHRSFRLLRVGLMISGIVLLAVISFLMYRIFTRKYGKN